MDILNQPYLVGGHFIPFIMSSTTLTITRRSRRNKTYLFIYVWDTGPLEDGVVPENIFPGWGPEKKS